MKSVEPAQDHPETCFECDAPVETVWHDHSFPYGVGGSAVELTARIPVLVCTGCDAEALGHAAEVLMHEAVCRHHGVLNPREIREIREAHSLPRTGFAELSGLSTASLNRWEKGILIQSQANDRYLRLLESPDNIWVLRRLTNELRSGHRRVSSFETSPGASSSSTAGARPEFRHVGDARFRIELQPAFRVRAA